MSRSKVVRKVRNTDSDSKYGSKLVAKIIRCAMYDGKKDTSAKIFYGAVESIKSFITEEYKNNPNKDVSTNPNPTESYIVCWFVEHVINKIAPSVEIKSRRIGGANYQIPVALSAKRRLSLAIRWLIEGARIRKERGMQNKFASEMKDCIHDRGEAIKKRDSMHKIAEANKAFAHYGANG